MIIFHKPTIIRTRTQDNIHTLASKEESGQKAIRTACT
jgi:hypothetical protein